MSPNDYIKTIVGGFVSEAKPGHGSFLRISIDSPDVAHGVVTLWIYLASWALLQEELEIVASDMANDEYRKAKTKIDNITGRFVKSVTIFDDNEVHIQFSGQFRLEVWPRPEEYGAGVSLIKIYCDDKYVVELCDVGQRRDED